MKRAALPVAALAAATISLAQQPAPAEPPASTTPQKQRAPAADSSPRMSETEKLILLGDCMTAMQAAHPSVPDKDAKAYCEKRVKSYSFPQN